MAQLLFFYIDFKAFFLSKCLTSPISCAHGVQGSRRKVGVMPALKGRLLAKRRASKASTGSSSEESDPGKGENDKIQLNKVEEKQKLQYW